MKYSRYMMLPRDSALGLSRAVLGAVLGATGHAAATPNRASAFLQGGSLNMSTVFVPAAQQFAEQASQWGGENNLDVMVDFINWPGLQPCTTSTPRRT